MAKNGNTETVSTPTRKPLAKDEKRALFASVDKMNADISGLEGKLDAAIMARSTVIKEIKDKVGTGPFNWNGKIVTIRTRDTKVKVKDSDGNEVEKMVKVKDASGKEVEIPEIRSVSFFVGQGDSEVQVI